MSAITEWLSANGTMRKIPKKNHLYFQGEIPRKAMYLMYGAVKSYSISASGNESIVHLYGKSSYIPIGWLNNQAPTALFHYEALTDLRVVEFSKAAFYEALDDHADMKEEFLTHMRFAHASLLLRTNGLCQQKAIDKISYALYYFVFRHGIEKSPGVYAIDLPLTQSIIANFIGQTRENTAKTMKQLLEESILELNNGTYYVHQKELEDFVGEDAFRQLRR